MNAMPFVYKFRLVGNWTVKLNNQIKEPGVTCKGVRLQPSAQLHGVVFEL